MPRAGHHCLRRMQRISGRAPVHGAAQQPQPQNSTSSRSDSICRPGSAEGHHLSSSSSDYDDSLVPHATAIGQALQQEFALAAGVQLCRNNQHSLQLQRNAVAQCCADRMDGLAICDF